MYSFHALRLVLAAVALTTWACDRGAPLLLRAQPDPPLEARVLRVDDTTIQNSGACAVIDPVWWTANIHGDVGEYEASLAQFSTNQARIFALCWYVAEVSNGGHDQFFSNSTGIVWPDALAALDAIGSEEGATILREAVGRLGDGALREREERNEQLERLGPDFDDLDTRFYAISDIESKAARFVRAHRSDFHFEGTVMVPAGAIPQP